MAGSRIQLDGVIRLGATILPTTDYSLDISSLVLQLTRNQVTIPATYGAPREVIRLGSRKDTVQLNFMSDESDALGVYTELMNAFILDAGIVYFQARWKAGIRSATNPEYTGSFAPTDLDVGTSVGDWKMQNHTYPLISLVGPLVS